jgi:hypothetical protein
LKDALAGIGPLRSIFTLRSNEDATVVDKYVEFDEGRLIPPELTQIYELEAPARDEIEDLEEDRGYEGDEDILFVPALGAAAEIVQPVRAPLPAAIQTLRTGSPILTNAQIEEIAPLV